MQKDFIENKTKEKRRLTLFPGMLGEDSGFAKFQKSFNKNVFNFDNDSENDKNNSNKNKNNLGSINEDMKSRKSVFMPGFGSLTLFLCLDLEVLLDLKIKKKN